MRRLPASAAWWRRTTKCAQVTLGAQSTPADSAQIPCSALCWGHSRTQGHTCSRGRSRRAGAARATHLAWNWRDILATLVASPAFAVFFCGHDHVGGYRDVGRSLHFVTLEALLEGESGLLHAWPS